MNAYQSSKFRMYHCVLNFLTEHKNVWDAVPGYVMLVEELRNLLNSIISMTGQKARNLAGVAIDTKIMKEELSQASLVISGTLVAIAAREKNYVMLKAMNFNRSQLEDMSAESLPSVCRNILSNADTCREALLQFNITGETIAAYEQLIIQYEQHCTAPRNAIVTRKSLGELVKELFAEADNLLKYQLDKVTQVYKKENRSFYNEYKYNRMIVNQGSRSTRITGTVRDKKTGKPVKNVLVSADSNAFFTNTRADGTFVLKVPKTGMVPVKFELRDYITIIKEDVELKLGKTTELDLEMEAGN